MRPGRVAGLAALFLALTTSLSPAQDTRVVTEPVMPPACTTLKASLTSIGDSTVRAEDEGHRDTQRIQAALDGCAPGRAVVLAAEGPRNAFLTGPLQLRAKVALVVGGGVTLYGSRDPADYAVRPGSCGMVNDDGKGCLALIRGERIAGAAVMGPGTIDGRGWAKLAGRDSSWWDLAQFARKGGSQNNPRMLQLTRSDDFTLYRVTLRNSANFHVVFDRGNGFTAWGVIIDTPDKWARNTDGIDPISASNVTITRSSINTGDDNIAIKAGSGGPTRNISVTDNHFYRGHGVSIGSETFGTVRGVRVRNLSIEGADNGLRIKSNASRGGLVEDVEYRDVCIRATKNPIEMDTRYTASPETTGVQVPVYRNIRAINVRVLDKGTVTLQGYDAARPLEMHWDDVWFDQPGRVKVIASDARMRVRGSNLPLAGSNVRVDSLPGEASAPNRCEGKFVPRPRYAAIVDAAYTGTEGDSLAGIPMYRSLGAALTGLPANGGARTVIFLRNGRYREKLTIDRPRITIVGESRDSTVLTFDAAAGMPAPGGGTWGTRGSYTVRIVAPDFRAERLTIENAFDYLANAAKDSTDRTKLRDAQGVALMLDTGSDRATFEDVRILGHQDTLFPNAGRAYFRRCLVAGSVDFIFGAGQAVFDECDIVSRDRGSRTNNGYVTAASTRRADAQGFLFIRSRLLKESPAMPANSVTLGRPWHPFGDPDAVASVAFVHCWMDDHIGSKGWERMSALDSTGARVWYEPASARLAEYGTTGPGAQKSARRPQLTAPQAAALTPRAVLRGWLPPLGP